jgi:hypothetical protein
MSNENLKKQFEERKIFNSTLAQTDADNLNWIMSLSKDQFFEFYDTLDDNETQYVEVLFDTFKLDLMDKSFDDNFIVDVELSRELKRISKGI